MAIGGRAQYGDLTRSLSLTHSLYLSALHCIKQKRSTYHTHQRPLGALYESCFIEIRFQFYLVLDEYSSCSAVFVQAIPHRVHNEVDSSVFRLPLEVASEVSHLLPFDMITLGHAQHTSGAYRTRETAIHVVTPRLRLRVSINV